MSDPVKPALLGMVPATIPDFAGGVEECWVYVKGGLLELRHASYEGEPDPEMTALTLNREQALVLGALILTAGPLLAGTPAPLEERLASFEAVDPQGR